MPYNRRTETTNPSTADGDSLAIMKALLLREYQQFDLVDLPIPDLHPQEVLVRVEACGICGSDVHGFDGSTGRRIPPVVMGHEAAGRIERVGDAVSRFALGDRVTFDSTIFCGACSYCKLGKINLCSNRQVLGVSCDDYRRFGAFAEFVAVPERVVHRLPDQLPTTHAALIEAVSVAVHAVRRSELPHGGTAVVVGTGMIGLLVVQALRTLGAGRVIAIDVDDRRLSLAREMGAEQAINATSQDAKQQVLQATEGEGADVALEVVGATEPLRTSIDCVRKGGSITLVGNVSPTVELPLQAVVTRELTLYGSCASQGEYPQCIELMATGKIDVAQLISAVAPLEEGPQWFQRLYDREPGLLKVVLTP